MLTDELADRAARLARLAEAKGVLHARAQERDAAAQAAYRAKLAEREAKAPGGAAVSRAGGRPSHRRSRGRARPTSTTSPTLIAGS